MPHALLHVLNIGTLSAWLSLAGFGTVGMILRPWAGQSAVAATVEESQVVENEFQLGDETSPATEREMADTPVSAFPVETLPAPPEMPPLAESLPLPEIPDLPEAPVPSAKPPAEISREIRSKPQSESKSNASRSRSGAAPAGKSATSPQAGSSGSGGAISSASRLAAGRMPAPSYPAESRRKGQTGTVLVEFTVDASGRVISAYAKSPSPWPLLNNEAVRTVRRWKFPPGGIMKLQRPIVFQLR